MKTPHINPANQPAPRSAIRRGMLVVVRKYHGKETCVETTGHPCFSSSLEPLEYGEALEHFAVWIRDNGDSQGFAGGWNVIASPWHAGWAFTVYS